MRKSLGVVAAIVMMSVPSMATPRFYTFGNGNEGASSAFYWVSDSGLAAGYAVTASGSGAAVLQAGGVPRFIASETANDLGSGYLTSGQADGSLVAGVGWVDGDRAAFTYSDLNGVEVLPASDGSLWVHDVSSDGMRIVGTDQFRAVVWEADEQQRFLGNLPGARSGSYGYGISSDGSIVVGKALNEFGRIEAFRWTEETGMVAIGGLLPRDDPYFRSEADKISADGSTIVGWTRSNRGAVPFRWTAAGGLAEFGVPGALYGGEDAYFDIDISGDGSVIVGTSFSSTGAFIFTEDDGIQPLSTYIASLGLDTGDWDLVRASAVSENGRFIAGSARNSSGMVEGFLVVVPEPSAAILMATGLSILAADRKQRMIRNRWKV